MPLKPHAEGERPRDARPRRPGAWWLLLLVVPLAALGYLACYEPAGVPIESGSRIYLAGATWGKAHRVTVGKGWQRALLTLWPNATGFGGQVASFPSSNDQLNVWMRVLGQLPPGLFPSFDSPLTQAEIVDEHGCRFGRCPITTLPDPQPPSTTAIQNLSMAAGSGGTGLLRVEPANFPRRTGSFTCRLVKLQFGQKEPSELWRVVVPAPTTPVRDLGPVEAFPIRRRIDQTELVVDRVRGALSSPALAYHTEAQGRRSRQWWPSRITVTDATGNVVSTDAVVPEQESDSAPFEGLCRFEPVWKYDLQLLRRAASEAPADRSWMLRIPIPATKKEQLLKHRLRDRGVEVGFTRVAGAHTAVWWDGTTVIIDRPTVRLRLLASPAAVSAVALRICGDSRGGAPRWAIPYRYHEVFYEELLKPPGPAANSDGTFELPVELGTRWVDVELRVNLCRQISFVARPPQD